MAEIAKGMKRFGLRLPKRTYRVLRTRARWEKRSCASLTREAINKYLVSEIERGRLCKAFKIIDYIFSGDKKHGIMFMDVLPQWLKEDEETCKELSFMAVRILRDYGIWITFPSVNRNAIRYEINDARDWSKLLAKYQSIRRRWRKEMDAGFSLA